MADSGDDADVYGDDADSGAGGVAAGSGAAASDAASSSAAPAAPSGEDIVKIMVATDCHVGFMEKDPVRGMDSFMAFEEILKTARERQVTFQPTELTLSYLSVARKAGRIPYHLSRRCRTCDWQSD